MTANTGTDDRGPILTATESDVHTLSNYAVESHERYTAQLQNEMVYRQTGTDLTMSIILPPSQSLTPNGVHEENHLFFHYISSVSVLMTPIDDWRNPWKSTYPSIAVQGPNASSTNALYHAILAQSAYHLSNLKGPGGEPESLSAMRYSSLAIRELKESLRTPTEDYSSVLAALLTLMLAEHVFRSNSRGWRTHFRGAIGFVSQFLAKQPWMLSHDAWVITQNFALSSVIAMTVGSADEKSSDHIGEIHHILGDVMSGPSFGYTIGGTARLFRMIYKTRQLEEQLAITGYRRGVHELSNDTLIQVEDIIRQLETPLDDDVEVYIQQQKRNNAQVVPQARRQVKLHLQLFNGAVIIYLFCTVLQYPPSAVASYVSDVLTNVMAFVELHNSNVSIWPVFIAAAEAYTPESLALARRCNSFSGKFAGNRKDIGLLLCEVWAERERLATVRHCDLGEVSVKWRDVMKRLNLDILFL